MAQIQGDPKSEELVEKMQGLMEEIKLLTGKNIELLRAEAERVTKDTFEENQVLNSKTLGILLEQAEQMAEDYNQLKEKYLGLKTKYKEECERHEAELKEAWEREREAIEKVLEQVENFTTDRKTKSEEQNEVESEVEKHYKSISEINKEKITKLEADLSQAERQIEIHKKDKKGIINNSNKTIDEILNNEPKDSDKVKKLTELLQQKMSELANEQQMQEMWISELELASKAYDQEKNCNKIMSKEVNYFP